MKTCPNCLQEVSKRKKGYCPHCGAALFIDSKKNLRLESDKQTVDEFLQILQLNIQQRDKVSVRFVTDSAERSYAYSLLDKTRTFIQANEEIGLSSQEMFLQTFNYVMTYDRWWYTNLKSTRMLSRQWEKMLAKYYKAKHAEYQQQQAQLKRMENVTQTILEYSYDVL